MTILQTNTTYLQVQELKNVSYTVNCADLTQTVQIGAVHGQVFSFNAYLG